MKIDILLWKIVYDALSLKSFNFFFILIYFLGTWLKCNKLMKFLTKRTKSKVRNCFLALSIEKRLINYLFNVKSFVFNDAIKKLKGKIVAISVSYICIGGSSWLNEGHNFYNSIIHNWKNSIFLYKYSFLPYLNSLWVPIEKKPTLAEHDLDNKNSFLLLTNLIPFVFRTTMESQLMLFIPLTWMLLRSMATSIPLPLYIPLGKG